MKTINIYYNLKTKSVWLIVFCFCYMFTKAQITTYPYFEDFESGQGGWALGATPTPTNSDWAYGTPNKPIITGAASGIKCWIIGGLTMSGTGYNNGEVSFITSPTFNFSSLSYPWISFKLFWETEKKWDGGNLQYSINNGATWVRVGAFGDPVDCMNDNWYNTNSISQLITLDPSKQGWGGNHYPASAAGTSIPNANATGSSPMCQLGSGSNGWVVAKHCLTGLAGQSNVRFRFTFGAGTTCNYYDGIAIDDIRIQEGLANAPSFTSACAGTPNMMNFTSSLPACPSATSTTLSWNFGDAASGASNASSATNPSHTFSSSGIYTVSLTQTGGPCNPPGVITHTVMIMNSTITSSTNVTCFGGNNGSAVVATNNGSAPYTYTWSPIGGNTSTGTNLTAGNYTVTSQDALGCKKTATVVIIQPTNIIATPSFTNITCYGANNGSASVSATGGASGFTYTWMPTGGNSSSATNLSPGTYSVFVSDANTCQKSVSLTISQPTSALTSTINSTNAVCGSLGSATVSTTGGTPNYSYSWAPSGGSGNNANSLTVGFYTVTITDNNNCVNTATTHITSPSGPTVTVSNTSVSCFGGNDGSATATVVGGATPYLYNWLSSGGTNNTATNLTAGNYTLTTTDFNGCMDVSYISITQPPQIILTLSPNQLICIGQSATLASTVSSSSSYTVNWQPNNSNGNSITVSPTTLTTYTAIATTSNGCISAPAIVTVSVTPTISLTASSNAIVCNGASITLTTLVTGGNGNYQYSWLPNHETTASVTYTVNASQQYTISVGDGCTSASKTISVSVSAKPSVKIFPPVNGCAPLCVKYYDSTLIQSGNIAAWNWSFDNGQSSNLASPTICFTSAGSYSGTLNVITSNNCAYKLCDITGITSVPKPQADFTSNIGFESAEDNSTFIFTNASANYTNVVWKAPTIALFGNSITENYPNQGTYLVTLIATNSAGCVDSITKSIKVDSEFTFYAPNTFTPNDNGLNDIFLPMGTGWDPTSYTLSVFDRWGVQLFNTNDVNQGWDATYKGHGEKVQEDVYTWKVDLKDVFHKQHNFIGHVIVLK